MAIKSKLDFIKDPQSKIVENTLRLVSYNYLKLQAFMLKYEDFAAILFLFA